MFDGDQLHQFIASSRANIPLSYGNVPSFSSASAAFDPNYPPSSLSLHHLEPPPPAHLEKLYPLVSANSGVDSAGRSVDLWSNDELLALLKLRSSMQIWFPDFTWEHVSRRLAEVGYKRSPEECKEKLEEESRGLNESKILSELYGGQEEEGVVLKKEVKSCGSMKKRKRKDKFEMLKALCERVVKKMVDQQEELHKRMIDDLVRRDREKMEREEAWKNEEMIRVNKEMEMRSEEQASAAERQGRIIEFLKKFSCDEKKSVSNSSDIENPSTAPALVSDTCSRWPRDEVLALINLRCKMSSGNNEDSGLKGPLWERISQGMTELGYKRNAKRCKEKWENINKYFRKTKDGNKKRSVNSRTCPYFHHLTSLYTQGTLAPYNAMTNVPHQFHSP